MTSSIEDPVVRGSPRKPVGRAVEPGATRSEALRATTKYIKEFDDPIWAQVKSEVTLSARIGREGDLGS